MSRKTPTSCERLALLPLLLAFGVNALATEKDQTLEKMRREIESFNQRLAERDALILMLSERLKRLEARLGAATAPATDPSVVRTSPQSARSIPVATRTAQASSTQSQADTSKNKKAETKPSGPGAFEVDTEAAERALERTLTQAGALLLPAGKAEFEPNLLYTRRETTLPFFVTINGDLVETDQEVKRDELTAGFLFRIGLPWDSQLELGVPYDAVWEERTADVGVGRFTQSNNTSGFGDVTVGVAKTLLRERGVQPDLVARLTYNSDTGNQTSDGIALRGGFNELRGELVALKRQDPLAFVASAFYETAFEKDGVEPGDIAGFSLGTALAASPQTSLQFNFVQQFQSEVKVNGTEVANSNLVSGIFSVGASSILSRGLLFNGQIGIGLSPDAPDYFVRISFPFRFDLFN